MSNFLEQIKLYTQYVMPFYNKQDDFYYQLADELFFWGMIASMSKGSKNYDEHFERMVRAVRISVSRSDDIEGIIEEIKDINQNVTDKFSLAIFSIFFDFYLDIINTNTPFEKRRDLDTRMIACYYAGRKAGKRSNQRVIDPEKRRYELYQKYTRAREIAESSFFIRI